MWVESYAQSRVEVVVRPLVFCCGYQFGNIERLRRTKYLEHLGLIPQRISSVLRKWSTAKGHTAPLGHLR